MSDSSAERKRVGEPESGRRGVVVDRTLSLIRLPAETVLRVAPKTRMTKSAESALDRADAAARGAAGAALGDEGLRNDARALRAKIKSRQRPTKPDDLEAQEKADAEERADALEERQDALRHGEEALHLKQATERAKEERKTVETRTGESRPSNGGSRG